jgi:membrane-anchored glycerophosphoryl diester phosphodiesterase (GDPDase)
MSAATPSISSVSAIRARGVADILDTAFRLYRTHVGLLLGMTAIVLLPLTVLQVLSFLVIGTDVVVQLVQNLVVIHALGGALIYAASLLSQGRAVTRSEAYQAGWRRVATIVAAGILIGLIVIIPVGLIAVCVTVPALTLARGASQSVLSMLVPALMLLVLVPPLVYLSVRLMLVTPLIVLESLGPVQAIKRSWALTQRSFWRLLVLVVVLGLLSLLLISLPELLISFAGVLLMADPNLIQPMSIAAAVLTQCGTILVLPLQWLAYTLTYYDLRVRSEGYDLEQQIAQSAAE